MLTVQEQRDKLGQAKTLIDEVMLSLMAPATPVTPVTLPSAPVVGLQNAANFYDHIRGDAGELFPAMSADQFAGVQMDLKHGAGVLPLSWMAYCLATDYHETGTRMVGVREGFDVSDDWRKKHLRYYPYYGRGKPQITWEANYAKASKRLNELGYDVDLVKNPDQALDLEIATVCLIVGMLEGWYTGKKLRDYLPNQPTRQQYRNARYIINGTDKADLIAGYALVFEEALKLGDWK